MKIKKFTLLELLLVIAIILILLSLIAPMVIKAQRSAELVVCMNNLKSLGTATALYHKDNKRYFPTAGKSDYVNNGSGPLDKYLENADQTMICPMNPNEDESYDASATNSNTNDLNTNGSKGQKVSKILKPSLMSLMVSDELYSDGDDSDKYWHTLENAKYPFLAVGGSVKVLRFSAGMGTSNRASIDFTNDPY